MSNPLLKNPYVGPRAFGSGEKLFGREQEVRQVADSLIAQRIILLHSPSGAGKTSLIHAGLIPRLEQEGFQVLPVMRVNLDPPAGLAGEHGVNRYAMSALLSLEAILPEQEQCSPDELARMSFREYLEKRRPPDSNSEGLVLILEQFEEIFTTDPFDRDGKQEFFAGLGEALQDRSVWLLISMREDFLGPIEPYERFIPNRLQDKYRLDLLGHQAALRAIQMPLREVGITFEDASAWKLVEDLSRVKVQRPDGTIEQQVGPHIEPVQLQVVCYRLFETLPPGETVIDEQDLAMVGDVDQSLARYYEDVVVEVAATERLQERDIRNWFGHALITASGIRNLVMMEEGQSSGLPNAAINVLLNSHLVRAERRAGGTWYELAHDRLIPPILQNNALWFERHLSLFQKQAVLWIQQGRSEGLLLRGRELDEAEKEALSLVVTADEHDFLEACHALRERERRDRRQRITIYAAFLGSALFLISALFFAYRANNARAQDYRSAVATTVQYINSTAAAGRATAEGMQTELSTREQQLHNQARLARAVDLSLQAWSQNAGEPELALLLAVEAVRIADAQQTRQALVSLLGENNSPATGSDDVQAMIRQACQVAGRSLNEAEWEQYLTGEPYAPACRQGAVVIPVSTGTATAGP